MTAPELFNAGQHWVRLTRLRLCPNDRQRAQDLESEGLLALWRAAQDYDPTRGSWQTHAIIRIRGAMLHYTRSDRWEPRRIYEVQQKVARLRAERGELDDEQLAAALGIRPELLAEAAARRVVSLEDPVSDEGYVADTIADVRPGPEALAVLDPDPLPPLPAPQGPTEGRFTPDEDRILIAHFATHPYAEIGNLLGRSYDSVANRADRLKKLGRLPDENKAYWKAHELRWLARNLGHGHDYRSAAMHLNRSVRAVMIKAGQIEPFLRRKNAEGCLTLSQAARIFGCRTWEYKVRGWIRAGLLPAVGGGKGRPWMICRGDVITFMQEYPDRYEAALVAPEFRPYARPSSLPPGFLTPREAARILGIRVRQVWYRVQQGRIPARHFEGIAGVDRTWLFIPREAVKP